MENEEKKIEGQSEPEGLLMGVDEARVLQAKLDQITAERDEYLDGWRRAKADLVNYKKDEIKRLEEIAKFGSEELIRDLVVVLDSFDLSLAALQKDGQAEKGVSLIKSQLLDILRRRGLERMKAESGQPFDPAFHEAVGESEGGASGMIDVEIEAGYLLNGKVLRPSRVKVFK
jgi:molecular chaperone GrpE